MRERAFRIDQITGERSFVTRPLTPGRFDRDHVGAELGQDVPGELPAIIAEIQDSIRREHRFPYRPDNRVRVSTFAISPRSDDPTTNVPADERSATTYERTACSNIARPQLRSQDP